MAPPGSCQTEASPAIYALLPNRSRAEVQAYAATPLFRVVVRTEAVPMIAAPAQGVRAATYWCGQRESAGGIRCDGVAAIVVSTAGGVISIGLADPTQLGDTIHVELDEPAARVIETDAAVHVDRMTPIRLTLRVKDARGRTLSARLARA